MSHLNRQWYLHSFALFHQLYAVVVFIYMVSAVIHLLRHKPNFEKAE